MYDGSDTDTDEDETASAKVSSQIKIRDEHFAIPKPKSNRYHYNDEAILINVSPETMDIRLKSGSVSYPVNLLNTTIVRASLPLSANNASLWEGAASGVFQVRLLWFVLLIVTW